MKTLKIKHSLSIKWLITLFVIINFLNLNPAYSQLIVTPAKSIAAAEALVNSQLLGNGVTASNVVFTGQLNVPGKIIQLDSGYQIGSFKTGADTTNLGISKGIILSNGNVTRASQSNTLTSQDNYYPYFCICELLNGDSMCVKRIPGCQWIDSDLEHIEGCDSCTYDATSLEFDFIPSGNTINCKYVFASDEYPDYVCSSTPDVFGIFVTGPKPGGGNYSNQVINLAPNEGDPVSINNVNSGKCGIGYTKCVTCNLNNSQYYVDNKNGKSIVYNGFTKPLSALCDVIPSQKYHLKIALADVGDDAFDTSVFLEAKSFQSINTSVADYNKYNEGINIYPNPSNDFVTISYPQYSPNNKTILELSGITGSLLKTDSTFYFVVKSG